MQKSDAYDKARDAQRDVDQPSSSDFALDVSSTTDQDTIADTAIKTDSTEEVDSSPDVVERYNRPTSVKYTSHWRKRFFGLDDWVLVNFDALPDWLGDNDFILEGHRPQLSWRHVWQSLLYLHNQTGNIYSHGFCGLAMTVLMICTYIFVLAPQPGVTAFEYAAWSIFFFCAQYVLYVSATFHLTMCHSQRTSFVGGCCDYTGIVLMIYGSMFGAIYYAYECNRKWLYIYIGLFSALAIGCAVSMYVPVMNTARMRPWRSLLFTVFGLFAGIPLLQFVIVCGASEARQYGLVWMLVEGVVYITGAILFATRFPERLSPGMFDYLGHSHQFHHLCSGAGGFIHWYVMYMAFHRLHSDKGCPWP